MRWLRLHSGAGWVLVHLRLADADLTYDTVRPALVRTVIARFPRGVPRVDDRRVLNGILWVLRACRKGSGAGHGEVRLAAAEGSASA